MPDAFTFHVLEPPPDLTASVAEAARRAAEREREAADVLARAHEEADAIRARAHAEGFEHGRQDALGNVAPAVQAFAEAARRLTAETADLAERTELAAVELAMRVAEQALGAAIAAEPERVIDVVRGALRRLVERERVLLLVNPDDLDLVRDGVGSLVGELGGIEHCEVQAERRVARGGAVVRTEEGEVDATLQTKLDRAREVIEHELAGN
jgi:flagellar assembly protein FliH